MMKITDVRCRCGCGWSGTVGDCEPDIDGDGNPGCPACSKVITCDDSLPIILTITSTEITHDLFGIFGRHSLPTVKVTFQVPIGFRGDERLLQAVGKRVEIRILEEESKICGQ